MPYITFDTVKGQRELKKAIEDVQARTGQSPVENDQNLSASNISANMNCEPSNEDKKTEDWDKSLILEYLKPEVNLEQRQDLHISRTLDQFYYYSLPNTDYRDGDQVVYRYQDRKIKKETEKKNEKKEIHNNNKNTGMGQAGLKMAEQEQADADYVICMVDQLWLWVIDESTYPLLFSSTATDSHVQEPSSQAFHDDGEGISMASNSTFGTT
jgi:hypothetical protein